MNRKLLIATHGVFADGIKSALELIVGKQNSVYTLCAYTNDMTAVETPVKEIINSLNDMDELIIATDMLGGSVNNEFMKYLDKPNIHLISGVNLPLLCDLVMDLDNENTIQVIENAICTAKEHLQYCNPLFLNSTTEETF